MRAAGVIALLSLLCVSCGGGGGPAGTSGIAVSADRKSINLDKTVAESILPITIRVTPTHIPDNGLWAQIGFGGDAIQTVDWADPFSLDLQVVLWQPGDLVPGRYSGSIVYDVCIDGPPCERPLIGSPISIPVVLAVRSVPSISVSADPTHLEVAGYQSPGNDPTGTTILTLQGPLAHAPHVSVQQSQLISDFSITMLSPTSAELTAHFVNPVWMLTGTHSEELELTLCYTPSCTNKVSDSPLALTVDYTVLVEEPLPEPGVPPLIPAWIETLSHNVVDAEYSKALDAVVMVSSYPSNALYVFDPGSRSEKVQPLAKIPTSVSVGPDGLAAAVGHDALVTYVDLTQVGEIGAPPTLLNVSTNVHDIVLDGRGFVHTFPLPQQSVNIHSVEVSTNTEYIGNGTFHGGENAKLHPSGDYIYGANNGLSPADIEKFDIISVPTTYLYDSPYHGDFAMCGNLWLSEDGLKIFTACGNVFDASTVQANDMIYAGALPLASPTRGRILSLSHSQAQNEIALIEEEHRECLLAPSSNSCYTHLALYESDFFNRNEMYSFPPVTVAGVRYHQRGLLVFHSADGQRKFTISKLYGIQNPAAEFYLSGL